MQPTILFIGSGKMATSLIQGLHQEMRITVTNHSNKEKLDFLQVTYGVKTGSDWRELVYDHEIILLAVPPKYQQNVLVDLSPLVTNQLVITVAAGVGLRALRNHLPQTAGYAWVMPNTAAEVKQSLSLYAYDSLNERHRKLLQLFLDGIGTSVHCTEEQIKQLTAISGSAPAFVYQFAHALEEVTVSFGLSTDDAKKIVGGMILGAGMMLQGDKSPAALRDGVTTPGGSTAAGLATLETGGFSSLLQQAIHDTRKKAEELAKE